LPTILRMVYPMAMGRAPPPGFSKPRRRLSRSKSAMSSGTVVLSRWLHPEWRCLQSSLLVSAGSRRCT
ncbi:hypothetical protein CLOP_g823, partial [Closterium sp. NIES-67]